MSASPPAPGATAPTPTARLSWPKSIAVALIGAVLGCLAGGLIALLCIDWYRISSFEGGSGYFVLGLGCVGIPAGFALALVAARLVASSAKPTFLRALGAAFGTIAVVCGLAIFLAWGAADLPPTLDGQELQVEIEVLLPEGVELPGAEPEMFDWSASITADRGQRVQRTGPLRYREARREGERWIVPATVALATSQPGKSLGVDFGGEAQYFRLPLRGRPIRDDFAWSEWLEGATSAHLEPIPAASAARIRFRVQPWVDPPEPTEPLEPESGS